jgi:hypothetical protein
LESRSTFTFQASRVQKISILPATNSSTKARYVADALGYDFLRSSLNRDAEPECLGATGAINDEGRLFGASPIEQAIGTLAASSRRAMA